MLTIPLNSEEQRLSTQELISTKALAGKTPAEVAELLKACPDYTKVRELGDCFEVFDGHQTVLVWYDKTAGTWVGQPSRATGGIHCLQANGAYSPY